MVERTGQFVCYERDGNIFRQRFGEQYVSSLPTPAPLRTLARVEVIDGLIKEVEVHLWSRYAYLDARTYWQVINDRYEGLSAKKIRRNQKDRGEW